MIKRRYRAITEHNDMFEGWAVSEEVFLEKVRAHIGMPVRAFVFQALSCPDNLSYEAIRIVANIVGDNHPRLIKCLSRLNVAVSLVEEERE